MRYQGGKAIIAKEIFEIINKITTGHKWSGEYFEPFCGLLHVAVHFANEGKSVLANDINLDLIMLLRAIKRGWIPPTVYSKEIYDYYKASNTHSAERGFYGFACAYSGIFFAGYSVIDEHFNRFRRLLMDLKEPLQNIKLVSNSYDSFKPKKMTIYCDPPYRGNKFGTEHFSNFDSDAFWDTMRKWSKNNLVFISEYEAPDDFLCIWKKKMKTRFNNVQKERVERLFIYKFSS